MHQVLLPKRRTNLDIFPKVKRLTCGFSPLWARSGAFLLFFAAFSAVAPGCRCKICLAVHYFCLISLDQESLDMLLFGEARQVYFGGRKRLGTYFVPRSQKMLIFGLSSKRKSRFGAHKAYCWAFFRYIWGIIPSMLAKFVPFGLKTRWRGPENGSCIGIFFHSILSPIYFSLG